MSAHPIEQVLAALNAAEVRYLIAGGVAVVLHGHLRTTADLDLVVALDHANASRAILALQSLGFRPRAPVPADQFAGLEVDRFVKEPFDFEQGYARAVVVQLDIHLRQGRLARRPARHEAGGGSTAGWG
jgi:hypothetical protein